MSAELFHKFFSTSTFSIISNKWKNVYLQKSVDIKKQKNGL